MAEVGFCGRLTDIRIAVFSDFKFVNPKIRQFFNWSSRWMGLQKQNRSFTSFRISPAGSDARKAAQVRILAAQPGDLA
jgi:hypothetical protein